jgi:hypothetical protein
MTDVYLCQTNCEWRWSCCRWRARFGRNKGGLVLLQSHVMLIANLYFVGIDQTYLYYLRVQPQQDKMRGRKSALPMFHAKTLTPLVTLVSDTLFPRSSTLPSSELGAFART